MAAMNDSRTTTPLSVYLPFNRNCLRDEFEPAKRVTKLPDPVGSWIIVQDQGLLVVPDGDKVALPSGECPPGLDGKLDAPLCLGTYCGTPCWVASLPKGAAIPDGFKHETLVPMRGTKLPDELLSLGGMAMQALWWQSTSGFCPRCGTETERIEGEWGKRCPKCKYEHYPHLHPAV